MNIEIVPNLRPLTEEEVDNYIETYPGVGLVRFEGYNLRFGCKFAYILFAETPVPHCRICDVPCKIQRTWEDTDSNPEYTLFAKCLNGDCPFNIYFKFEPGVVDEEIHAIFPHFEITKAYTPDL